VALAAASNERTEERVWRAAMAAWEAMAVRAAMEVDVVGGLATLGMDAVDVSPLRDILFLAL
jgi:hypothetical protein